jgi:hypothetical protein
VSETIGNVAKLTASATIAQERHFDVAEIAALWNLSQDKVRRMFENEANVMVIQEEISKHRSRRYRTLRIPESVMTRVHRRLSN